MKRKYVLSIVILSLAAVLGGCGSSPKKAPEVQALECYQEILQAAPALEGEHPQLEDASFDDVQNREQFGSHYDQFAVFDINKDGIPELIASSVINFRWVPISVFTWADGKAVLLTDPAGEAANGTFEQCSTANGAYITYLCEENHIHSVWRGMTPVGEAEEDLAYSLDGSHLTAAVCTAPEGGQRVFFSDIAQANTAQNAAAITHP